jgi:hypothetical protein
LLGSLFLEGWVDNGSPKTMSPKASKQEKSPPRSRYPCNLGRGFLSKRAALYFSSYSSLNLSPSLIELSSPSISDDEKFSSLIVIENSLAIKVHIDSHGVRMSSVSAMVVDQNIENFWLAYLLQHKLVRGQSNENNEHSNEDKSELDFDSIIIPNSAQSYPNGLKY